MANKKESDIPETVFSFRYYDTDSDKWCMSCWKDGEIKTALKQLKEINQNKCTTLKGNTWHFHPVVWKKTIYPKGFTNPLLNDMEAWQIALPSVKQSLTRVFGVLAKNIFYIVWFDLDHEIWPTKNK